MGHTSTRRKALRRLLILASTALIGLLAATTAHAEPSLSDVEKQLDAAWEKLEPVIEQYNGVRSQLAANQKKAAALGETLKPLELQIEQAMSQVGLIAANEYKHGRASALNALLTTGSPQTFADQLALLNRIARVNADRIAQVAALRDKYTRDKQQIDTLVAQQKQQEAELAAKKAVIQAEINRLEALRRQLGATTVTQSSLYIGSCPAVYIGGAAGIAVKTACAQIGKPYVWGADGPDSFDCSGLTQYSWKAAGVYLTHFTGAQWREGTPVARADLRPGDLVFFYSDLHHVGLYVGNGLMVHASRTGVPVKMARMDYMPYMGARRPG